MLTRRLHGGCVEHTPTWKAAGFVHAISEFRQRSQCHLSPGGGLGFLGTAAGGWVPGLHCVPGHPQPKFLQALRDAEPTEVSCERSSLHSQRRGAVDFMFISSFSSLFLYVPSLF